MICSLHSKKSRLKTAQTSKAKHPLGLPALIELNKNAAGST